MAAVLLLHSALGFLLASPERFAAVRPSPRASARMLFAQKPPPEVMDILKPNYEGAARGGKPFVVGTEQELVAIWNAMVRVYGGRDDALTAVRKNQAVILPYSARCQPDAWV